MNKKDIFLGLVVAGFIIALMAAVYVSGAVPVYNDVLDTAFSDIASLFGKDEADDVGSVKKPAPATEKISVPEKKPVVKNGFELTDNGYAIDCYGECSWKFESSWPFVTEPILHEGKIISVTAEPAFIMLSQTDGGLVAKQDSPVYPGEKLSFDGNIMTLSGRNGQSYKFRLESDDTFTDMRQEETDQTDFLSLFVPDEKTQNFMTTRLREWSADTERVLPEMKLYTGHINREGNGNWWAQQNETCDTVFYIFTPDEQGIYQIGLADENGSWIQANAFVAVFGETGDLKQVSLDYVANKPIIKLHLSEEEIYYIVGGWAKDMYDGSASWLQIAESR